MILSCRFLENVADVNNFTYSGEVVEFSEGDDITLYFQLVDLSKDKGCGIIPGFGKRYMPDAVSTLSVVIENIDDAKKITRVAEQPFASDPSIWSVQLFPTDNLRGTSTLRLTLVEGTDPNTVTHKGKVLNAVRVRSSSAL